MKTKELIEKVRELEYGVKDVHDGLYITNQLGRIISYVSESKFYVMDTDFSQFLMLDYKARKELLSILVEYVNTPIEDRKEVKKYRLKLQLPGLEIRRLNYLNYDKEEDEYFVADRLYTSTIQTIFTEKEIEELDKKSNILSLFVKEEVTNDN